MRVELCGDLLVEPNTLRQQPSTISSNCSNRHQCKNIQFSELNHFEVPIIGHKREYSLDNREQRSVFGFTLNEEEWSLANKSHSADLEPYERKKMCSLPKSFTPFSTSSSVEGVLECDRNLNRSASNSILLRKCESLSPTPSHFLVNGGEPNNNVPHPSSLSKVLLLRKSHDGFQEDEKENWLCDEGWNSNDPPLVESTNYDIKNNSVPIDTFGKERPFLWETAYPVGQDDCKVGEIEVEFLPSSRFPFTHSTSAVGTIGSHPNPIISCSEDQVHYHHHYDLSTSQQTSFPATIYNFNSVDPLLYADCYDEWNANVASLCENNSTPVIYPESHPGHTNGFALPTQPITQEAGHENFNDFKESSEVPVQSGEAVEEVNTLSTFLSKFDDKVAAIWGHQSIGRSTVGSNFLSIDGCISSASTPLGSSNPWGSPSSDISSAHGPEYRAIQHQQQNGNQVTLAADALLSAGYGLSQHEIYQFDQPPKQQNSNGRVNVCDLTISPPKGNYNIMHSMKQYFGSAPPEGEYYIIKKEEASSTEEELKKSLAVVNHTTENSGFVVCQQKIGTDRKNDIDLNTVAKALDSIDLENEADEEWEIVEACNKGKPQGCEGEDLLNSWKTHFRTVEQVETIASARGIDLLESPITAISAHQINPNLPEYRLFDMEVDGEHHVFQRPGQTMFPVKYKVFRQNEKANQTDDLGVDISSPVDPSQMMQAYKVASEWPNCLPIPTFEFSSGAITAIARNGTPVASYDGDSNAEYQPTEWCSLTKGVEYNGMWGEWAMGDETSNSLFPGTCGEYCDSGVDGVGSRSDFYDDMFGDYDGDYENFSGLGFTFTGFTTANDADTDYGQFQDATSLSGCDSSSVSGKQAKNSKRSKTRLRPCKYFFLEGSCRRGNDCKFSHDSITCRYWAEGSCLKGQNCPYVHCFIDGKKLLNHAEEYELPNSEKQYHLESETDFPALCSTKNTMLSSRQPVALGFGPSGGDGIRRLEDSLESLTVFTDSNSSVVEEEVTEPRRLFLFERFRALSPSAKGTAEKKETKKQISDTGGKTNKQSGSHRASEHRDWSETGSNRSLSKSKSLGDANSSAPWMRHSVSRSNSHTSTTGTSLGIPVKEKRKKKRH